MLNEDAIIHFSESDLNKAVDKMMKLDRAGLSKIFEQSGYKDMKFESVEFEDFHFGSKGLTAMYECTFIDVKGDKKLYVTNNFVSWDGKEFTADVSGEAAIVP
jgi:hypothetical protein